MLTTKDSRKVFVDYKFSIVFTFRILLFAILSDQAE